MLFDIDVSPKKLARSSESWTRAEILEGIRFFQKHAAGDSYFLRHIKVLIEELEARDAIGG